MTAPVGFVLPYPKFKAFVDGTNTPLVGGKVYTYLPGTTTGITTYSDAACTSANTNPVVLDSNGEADIFSNASVKIVLKDASDNTLWTIDNVEFVPSLTTSTVSEWVEQSEAWTYISATSFSTSGDVTASYAAYRRIKMLISGSTYYGTIAVSSYSAPSTTLTIIWDSGSPSADATTTWLGIITPANISLPKSIPTRTGSSRLIVDTITDNSLYAAGITIVNVDDVTFHGFTIDTRGASFNDCLLYTNQGAEGRDQASTFSTSDTIYYYFISDGVNVSTIGSLTSPASGGPTLPSPYIDWCYIMSVSYNKWPSAGTLIGDTLLQSSNSYATLIDISSANTSEHTVSGLTSIPSDVTHILVDIEVKNTSGSESAGYVYDTTTANFPALRVSATNPSYCCLQKWINMATAQTLYYLFDTASGMHIKCWLRGCRYPN